MSGQRRAQLMRGIRDERAMRQRGGVELGDHRDQRLHFLGHVVPGHRPQLLVADIAQPRAQPMDLLGLDDDPIGGPVGGHQQVELRKPDKEEDFVARPFENSVPDEAPPLDLITIVLNYHDIACLPVARAKMNARLHAALKPGGRLVVIDHSAKAGSGVADAREQSSGDGRIPTDKFALQFVKP